MVSRQNPTVLEQYDYTIKEQLEKGVIEAVDVSMQPPDREYYQFHAPCCRMHG